MKYCAEINTEDYQPNIPSSIYARKTCMHLESKGLRIDEEFKLSAVSGNELGLFSFPRPEKKGGEQAASAWMN